MSWFDDLCDLLGAALVLALQAVFQSMFVIGCIYVALWLAGLA